MLRQYCNDDARWLARLLLLLSNFSCDELLPELVRGPLLG